MTKSIAAFQDEHGRITSWPSDRRRAHQLAVLSHLSAQLEAGKLYSEDEMDTFLNDQSTVEDTSVLRRELIDGDYLMNENGSYWKAGSRPTGTTTPPNAQDEAAMLKPPVR